MTREHKEVIVSKTAVDARVHELGEREAVAAGVLLKELESISSGEGLGRARGVDRRSVSGHFGGVFLEKTGGRRRRYSRRRRVHWCWDKYRQYGLVVLSQEKKKRVKEKCLRGNPREG